MKKYIQALGIWALMIPIAILNGGFRENVLIKLGDIASPLSAIILSVCILVMTFLLLPKIKECSKKDYIIIGIMWCVLTNLFDLSMYIKSGGGFSDLIKAYDFLSGNLWIVVVLTTLLSPMIVAKMMRNCCDKQ